jgi:HK97 family phage portal protein
VAYNTLVFENNLVATGGQRKGFLKSAGRLSVEAINQLKTAFKNLYSNSNSESIVVLNNGLEFQESNNNSVELQLNQQKTTNSDEIAKMLNIPVELLNGKVTQFELLYNGFVKLAIMPIVKAFESALNKDLLLEIEKGSFYFAVDTSDLEKFAGNILQRFQAYQIGIASGVYKVDEVRALENLEPIGFDYVKLGLQDVLYDPDSKEIYTPNTNKLAKMGEQPTESAPVIGESPTTGNPPEKGGEKQDESGNQKQPSET